MRRIVIFTVLTAIVVVLVPAAASAHHRPTIYCSPTGDICQSTTKVNGVRMLRITLAAEYFSRYRLCVTPPQGPRTCRGFRVHEADGGFFASSVRWAHRFPDGGPGAYKVAWRSWTDDSRIGRALGFHVPA